LEKMTMAPAVVVNVQEKLFRKIMDLVDQGQYVSAQEFLISAAHNQLALNESQAEQVVAPAPPKTKPSTVPPTTIARHPSQGIALSRQEVQKALARLGVPDSNAWELPLGQATIVPLQAGERIWAQVNRLLPIKIAVRFIAGANIGRENWLRLSEILQDMVAVAATIGSELERLDETAGRKRDELLSTGLPRRGNTPSCERYLQQFVARVTKSGRAFPGAAYQYQLVGHEPGPAAIFTSQDPCLLTEVGSEFARLWNPVLDGNAGEATTTLSDDERRFFVQRVLPLVPSEVQDVLAVLQAVEAGKRTPAELVEALRASFPDQWSDMMVRTQISGIVARMLEMGTLRRKWDGRFVSYEVAPLASEVPTTGVGETVN
jgi:hypothetical protein